MKHLFQVFYLLFLILLRTSLTEAELDYAKPGCKDRCGGILIPYPFGIGANCSINVWYTVDCKSSIPYLSAFSNKSSIPYLSAFSNPLEVLDISLDEQLVTVIVPKIFDCQINPPQNKNQMQCVDLDVTPYLISESHNVFIVEGCGNAFIQGNRRVVTGCSATCPNHTTIGDRKRCFGFGCCLTTIPYYLKSFSVNLTRLESGSAFLLDEAYLTFFDKNEPVVPVSLKWTLTADDLTVVPTCWEYELSNEYVMLGHGDFAYQRKCSCGYGRQGNPYLHYKCQGIFGSIRAPTDPRTHEPALWSMDRPMNSPLNRHISLVPQNVVPSE